MSPLPDMTDHSRRARLLKTVVGTALVIVGLAGTALVFIPYRRAMETRAWTETPCVITGSYIDTPPGPAGRQPAYRVHLAYQYSFGGRDYTGTRWRRISFLSEEDRFVARRTPHLEEAEKLSARYPPGLRTVCWVDPSSPAEAVLEHQSRAAIYTLWWPMLFAVGGAGMIRSVWRQRRRMRKDLRGGTAAGNAPP
jgi:Protein of unknown function (DUF3592)